MLFVYCFSNETKWHMPPPEDYYVIHYLTRSFAEHRRGYLEKYFGIFQVHTIEVNKGQP